MPTTISNTVILEFLDTQEERMELERQVEDMKQKERALKLRIIEALDNSSMEKVTIEEGPTVSRSERLRVTVAKANGPAWVAFLKDNGFQDSVVNKEVVIGEGEIVEVLIDKGSVIPEYVSLYYEPILHVRRNGYGRRGKEAAC